MSFESIRNRIAKLGPKPPGWQRKPTTSETRQELQRILAHVESLPADAPPHPDSRGLVEAQQELDRILAAMDARDAT